jgi:hypothetical protein
MRINSSAILSYFYHLLYIIQYIPITSLVSIFWCNIHVKSFLIDFIKDVCLSCTVTFFNYLTCLTSIVDSGKYMLIPFFAASFFSCFIKL